MADKMTPLTWLQDLAADLPQADLQTISGAGHYVILEQPQRVSGIIRGWLAAFPKSPSSE
jgi:pimeloyl-ACP methyl ester carboxylesterase